MHSNFENTYLYEGIMREISRGIQQALNEYVLVISPDFKYPTSLKELVYLIDTYFDLDARNESDLFIYGDNDDHTDMLMTIMSEPEFQCDIVNNCDLKQLKKEGATVLKKGKNYSFVQY